MSHPAFHFCKNCAVAEKCCTNPKPNGELGPPYLTEDDVKRIERFLQKPRNSFSDESVDQESSYLSRSIKTRPEGGCIFYRDRKCQIYEARPLDCRLFPLDICRIGNEYFWVVYHTFCGKTLDFKSLLQYGEEALQRHKPDLAGLASRLDELSPSLPYTMLAKVDWQNPTKVASVSSDAG